MVWLVTLINARGYDKKFFDTTLIFERQHHRRTVGLYLPALAFGCVKESICKCMAVTTCRKVIIAYGKKATDDVYGN
ncbi:unnamed protein product [Thelazia callipaeda]|uniref:Secreted protein n=1 Tax=Thelazia callipaeda TaxID=103827 RepID=A0A0N5D5X2_THECL|nr:unnamed protein product [Thelazia callipaeda]